MSMTIAQIPSPHGASHNQPNKIIVHAISEFLDLGSQDQIAWSFLDSQGISAHAFVTPSGVVVRTRDDHEGAYHARGHNTNSLGVEFMVPGVHTYPTFLDAMNTDYLTPAAYDAGLTLVRGWVRAYGITKDNLHRHSDVSPGRKMDPGYGFPWDRFRYDVFA